MEVRKDSGGIPEEMNKQFKELSWQTHITQVASKCYNTTKNTLEIDKTQKSIAEKRLNWQIYRIIAEEITERQKSVRENWSNQSDYLSLKLNLTSD